MRLGVVLSFLCCLSFVFVGCVGNSSKIQFWKTNAVKPSGVVLPPATIQGEKLGVNDEPPVGFSPATREFVVSPAQVSELNQGRRK